MLNMMSNFYLIGLNSTMPSASGPAEDYLYYKP